MNTIIQFRWEPLSFLFPMAFAVKLFQNSGKLDGKEGWAFCWCCLYVRHATGPSKVDLYENEKLRQFKIKYLGHP